VLACEGTRSGRLKNPPFIRSRKVLREKFGSNIMWMRHRLVFASRSVDNQERFQWATLEVKLKWRCILLSLLKVSGSSLLNFHRNRAAGIVIGA
jgi:hypothetical protein